MKADAPNVGEGSGAAVVARLMVRPVCPQFQKCLLRSGSYAWCQNRTTAAFYRSRMMCGAPLSLHVNPRPADRSAARIDNPSGIAALSEPSNGSLDLARASRPPSRAPATI